MTDSSEMLVARIRSEADAKSALGKEAIAAKSRAAANSIAMYIASHYRCADMMLKEIDRAWLDGYVASLHLARRTENTVSNYMRVILNTFRGAVKSGAQLDLTLLNGYFKGNTRSVKSLISPDEVATIANADLGDLQVLERTRNVFLLCLFSGGARISQLAAAGDRLTATRQGRSLLDSFLSLNILSFLGDDIEESYRHNLTGLAYKLGISSTLDDDAAAVAWVEHAKLAGIPPRIIAATVGRQIENIQVRGKISATQQEILAALQTVADRVAYRQTAWYAVLCRNASPAATLEQIRRLPDLQSGIARSYVPPVPPAEPKERDAVTLMRSMLFVRLTAADARYVKRAMSQCAYVFDRTDSDGKTVAAPLRQFDVQAFIHLADLTEVPVDYLADTDPLPAAFTPTLVTEGPLAGRTLAIAPAADANPASLRVLLPLAPLSLRAILTLPWRTLPH